MFNNLDIKKWDPIMETYFNFQWRYKKNYLCRETRAKGHLNTEFIFDQMNQAAALISICMQCMSSTKEKSSWSQYILLNGQTLWIYKNLREEKLVTPGDHGDQRMLIYGPRKRTSKEEESLNGEH